MVWILYESNLGIFKPALAGSDEGIACSIGTSTCPAINDRIRLPNMGEQLAQYSILIQRSKVLNVFTIRSV